MKTIQVNLSERSYPIYFENGLINHLSDFIDVHQHFFLITDDGVPEKWVSLVSSQLPNCEVYIVKQGEMSKSFNTYEACLKKMLDYHFSRKDCIIALGGGVVGDLSGFVAATYMRGIDFIQIPTTTLSQIDSSIGGKVAINVNERKNCVGAFWQPKAVLVDPQTLSTLSSRHFYNGLVEALKAGLLGDQKIIDLFNKEDFNDHVEEIIYRSLLFKKKIVEQDEKEMGVRKILNFGHTLGHGIESYYHLNGIYHGESVALGMLMVLKNEKIKSLLISILKKMNIQTAVSYDSKQVFEFIQNDKKGNSKGVSLILLDELQKPMIKETSWEEIKKMVEENQ